MTHSGSSVGISKSPGDTAFARAAKGAATKRGERERERERVGKKGPVGLSGRKQKYKEALKYVKPVSSPCMRRIHICV